MTRTAKNMLLLVASAVVSVAILEIGLRWLTIFPIHTNLANRVPDAELGYRMDPALPDIDDSGFRNPRSQRPATVVTIGDSHTFGFNVKWDRSWPQQLSLLSKETVYNFGVGGYGVPQYLHLSVKAIAMQPRYLIWGLYLANDLHDICGAIKRITTWSEWAKRNDFDVSNCVRGKETLPIHRRDIPPLLRSTAIGSLVQHFFWRPRFTTANAIIITEPKNTTFISHRRINSHKAFMDRGEKEIEIAIGLAKQIVKDVKREADSEDIIFGILFIPSKINVFYDYLIGKGYGLPSAYHQTVEEERALVEEFSDLFSRLGIRHADARSYLHQKLLANGQIYPRGDDSHPLSAGYTAYARAAYEGILNHGEESP